MFRLRHGPYRLRQNVPASSALATHGSRAGLAGLRPRHQSLISCTCFARAVQALMRNARSVPVET
jgi:hypothetical protein